MVVKVNADTCVGCGSCIGKCPARAISLNDNDVSFVIKDKCDECGLCLDICAHGAITIT
jgi:Fe-S-cluster-containing hydrogenase component 2